MSQGTYFSYFHKVSLRGNLEFWRIDIREICLQLGTISRLLPILVASIILQNVIVNSITIVKEVNTNENQSLLQVFTFLLWKQGENYTFNSKSTWKDIISSIWVEMN